MPREWTDNQRLAIETCDRDVCVAAGAGSGKTGVLVERFVRIVRESLAGGLPEEQRAGVGDILVFTFTEKATREMKSRIVEELLHAGLREERRAVESAYISTIHGFCSRLLKENPFDAGVDPEFTVLDETESLRLLRASVEDAVERAYAEGNEAITELVATAQDERVFGTDGGDPLAALAGSVRSGLGALRGAGWRREVFEQEVLGKGIANSRSPVIELVNASVGALKEGMAGLRAAGAGAMGTLGVIHKEVSERLFCLEELSMEAGWPRIVETLTAIQEIAKSAGKAGRARVVSASDAELQQALTRIKFAAEAAVQMKVVAAEREEQAELLCRRFWALLAASWREYEAGKRRLGALDNDDLQSEAVHLLETNPAVLRRYRRRFRYLLVDEFQDTNALQMRLIDLLHRGEAGEANANNLFIVGDVQQSIYGFRNADATIFQSIEREYRAGGTGAHVTLAHNFRSRPEILGLVNHLFGQMWRETQTRFTPLETGAAHSEKPGASIEFLLTRDVGRAQYVEMEADAIAERIKRLVGAGKLLITDWGHPRFGEPIRFGDVAILLRQLTDIEKYEKAFIRLGVPYFVVGGGRGYYARREVRDVMNVLTVLDTPLDDVALAAALRSPMAGLSADTLFALSRFARAERKGAALYPAIPRFLETGEIPTEDRVELERFLTVMETLRREQDRWPVGILLERIVAATQYDARLLVRPNGRRRLANVRKLLQMAHAASGSGVSEFIRRLREIEKISEREGDAPTEEEAADVVRLLSIHKAKGLEFPVVFVADMARSQGFSARDLFTFEGRRARIGCRLGEYKSASYRAIDAARQERELEESTRLLYVALTRAREHLVLCGSTQGRNRGVNWADMVFPTLGVMMPEKATTQIGPDGIQMRLIPMAAPLAPRAEPDVS